MRKLLVWTMRASGTVLWLTVIGVVSIWLVEVPVAYYLSYHTSLGIEGIWIGYPAAFIVSLILQYAYYKLSWQKKRITRLSELNIENVPKLLYLGTFFSKCRLQIAF
ncbi:hypothetical protein ACT7DL_19480 [Bacillus paranthracis]